VEFPCVSPQRQELAKALEQRIGSSSALAHSALADACQAVAEFDEIGGWCAPGIRSFAHWLAINAGFNLHNGSELLRVGQALRVLPRIAEAFSEGRLSFDKVRQITTVAAPATEDVFLEIALGASGSQLARICSSLRRIANADAPDHDQRQMAERGLWTYLDEDGMMRLVAKLLPEDAAVVMAAIESINGSKPVQPDSDVPDPAEEPWAARRADALVSMAEHVLARGATALVGENTIRQVVVHADINLLTGESPDGRCFIEGGAPLSVEAARRIGCDAEIISVTDSKQPARSGAESRWTSTTRHSSLRSTSDQPRPAPAQTNSRRSPVPPSAPATSRVPSDRGRAAFVQVNRDANRT